VSEKKEAKLDQPSRKHYEALKGPGYRGNTTRTAKKKRPTREREKLRSREKWKPKDLFSIEQGNEKAETAVPQF